jgi:hypothetical protein
MKRLNLFVVIAVVSLAFSGTAGATSSFDPPTGTGFVSAEDVQSASGWTNPQLRTQLKDISFTLNRLDYLFIGCDSGQAVFFYTRSETAVNTDFRRNGFVFTGLGATAVTYTIFDDSSGTTTVVDQLPPWPSQGDACPAGHGVVTHLYGASSWWVSARSGDQSVPLWIFSGSSG